MSHLHSKQFNTTGKINNQMYDQNDYEELTMTWSTVAVFGPFRAMVLLGSLSVSSGGRFSDKLCQTNIQTWLIRKTTKIEVKFSSASLLNSTGEFNRLAELNLTTLEQRRIRGGGHD